ncbi:hypothetical protein B4U80_07949, partial [Leptotrombidium deliense]
TRSVLPVPSAAAANDEGLWVVWPETATAEPRLLLQSCHGQRSLPSKPEPSKDSLTSSRSSLNLWPQNSCSFIPGRWNPLSVLAGMVTGPPLLQISGLGMSHRRKTTCYSK